MGKGGVGERGNGRGGWGGGDGWSVRQERRRQSGSPGRPTPILPPRDRAGLFLCALEHMGRGNKHLDQCTSGCEGGFGGLCVADKAYIWP